MSGLDPSKVGNLRTGRSVVYIRESAGNAMEQASALWKWEEDNLDDSRPAIWVREKRELPCTDTPDLDRVSQLIGVGRVGLLVVWRLDILAKTHRVCANFIIRTVVKHGCRFVSVDDMIDTALPSGRLFVRQMQSLGRFSREKALRHPELRDKRGGMRPTGPSAKTKRMAVKVDRLLRDGYSRREAASKLGISRNLITRMINEYHLIDPEGT